jgi:hypothetical protein
MAHDVATSIKVALGPRPKTSIDFARTVVDDTTLREWHRLFWESTYPGRHFLDLEGSKGKPLLLPTHKGGPWLSVLGLSNALIACFCQCISGHAPIGEYHNQFDIDRVFLCLCRESPLETRDHLLCMCPLAC